jgi:hypothetical protein
MLITELKTGCPMHVDCEREERIHNRYNAPHF